jgi:hypothetical protein
VELLFPSVDSVVAVFPLALLGYGDLYLCVCVCVCVFFFFFFFFFFFCCRKAKIVVLQGWGGGV